MVENSKGERRRKQELQFETPFDPRDALTDENKALLTFFASEIARYLEMGMNSRLDEMELRLKELGSGRPREEAKAVQEILRLFSKYKLSRILQALSRFASEDRTFTKNSLIRAAGVGQGFRREGLDRLVEILCSQGFLMEAGRRGRGVVFSATSSGKRFLESYVPRSVIEKPSWDDQR